MTILQAFVRHPGGSALAVGLVLLGCQPAVAPFEDATSGGSSGERPDSTPQSSSDTSTATVATVASTVTSGPTSSSPTSNPPVTTATTTGSATTDPSVSDVSTSQGPIGGCSFLCPPDGPYIDIECDVWTQDCPEGEKCMPWANDGGNSWNATRCSPVAANPDAVGEACVVEGSGVSGVDSCASDSMCWAVNADNNTGTCVAFCGGSEAFPSCAQGECFLSSSGVLNLCLLQCEPLLQDCEPGLGCYADSTDTFTCLPDASGQSGAYGEACGSVNACDPGLLCVPAAQVPDCAAADCCTPLCDVSKASTCPGAGQVCVPYFEDGQAPAGQENVGFCGAVP